MVIDLWKKRNNPKMKFLVIILDSCHSNEWIKELKIDLGVDYDKILI